MIESLVIILIIIVFAIHRFIASINSEKCPICKCQGCFSQKNEKYNIITYCTNCNNIIRNENNET